jgi:hypothetical protein
LLSAIHQHAPLPDPILQARAAELWKLFVQGMIEPFAGVLRLNLQFHDEQSEF